MDVGVALFAHGSPASKSGNAACAFRGEPFVFNSVSDLPSQTLWVTNASLDELVEYGLHRNPKIAHNGYFRTRLGQVVTELGLIDLSLEEQAAFLAEILGSSSELARTQLGLSQHPVRGLAQGVGQLYGASEPPEGSAMKAVAIQACQRYTSCERQQRYERAEIFSFWFPRYSWANRLLETPMPTNENLTGLPLHTLPEMGQDAGVLVEWAKQNHIPLFARVRIIGLDETAGRLMNYGAGAHTISGQGAEGGKYSARNLREWCSLPELEVLVQSGEIEILQVASASGWFSSGLHVDQDRLSPVSYAYGIVAENLWVGITRKPDFSGSVSTSLSTAWIQAVDRMECLRVAERMVNLGMEVINYGNGRVTVACPPSVRALIPQVAAEEGLMYPATLKGLHHYQVRQDRPDQLLQHLINTQNYSKIIEVNQLLLSKMRSRHEA